ncbi:hypothetical protein SMICM304S_07036 [Streptomyces microflavus]
MGVAAQLGRIPESGVLARSAAITAGRAPVKRNGDWVILP